MIEIKCNNVPWSDSIDFAVIDSIGRVTLIAEPLKMKELKEGELIVEPTFRLRNNQAQQLIDELWRVGLRPSEGTGSAGSLAATQKHLADMQKIAMGLLRRHGVE